MGPMLEDNYTYMRKFTAGDNVDFRTNRGTSGAASVFNRVTGSSMGMAGSFCVDWVKSYETIRNIETVIHIMYDMQY